MSEQALPALTDPRAPAAPGPLHRLSDRVFGRWLKDSRDVVFTRTATDILLFLVPFTLALYLVPTWALIVLGPLYLVHLFVNYAARITLTLHAVTHRPAFKRGLRRADHLFTTFFPALIGMPTFAYVAHHKVMHHNENVSESDLSGTAEYQRDNLLHFLHYWARFALLGYFHMTSWLLRRDMRPQAVRMIVGTVLGYTTIGVLLYLAPWPTLIAFVIPYLLMRYFLMAGNWSEHAFVDVDAPTNSMRNSVCLLNTGFNHRTANAGYHLVHHVTPGLHWSEHPAWLEAHVDELAANGAILFDGVRSNQQVWWKLMTGDYRFLAERMVDLSGRTRTVEERIALLKSRVQRRRGTMKGLFERREAAEGVPAGPAFGR